MSKQHRDKAVFNPGSIQIPPTLQNCHQAPDPEAQLSSATYGEPRQPFHRDLLYPESSSRLTVFLYTSLWKVLFVRKSLTSSLSEIITKLPQDKLTRVPELLIYLMGQVGETDRKIPGLIPGQLLPRDRPNLLMCRTWAVRLTTERNTKSYPFPNLSSMKQLHNVLLYITFILGYH